MDSLAKGRRMAHIKMNFLPCTGHQRYERDHHVLLATALCNLPDQHMGPALCRGREDQACRRRHLQRLLVPRSLWAISIPSILMGLQVAHALGPEKFGA